MLNRQSGLGKTGREAGHCYPSPILKIQMAFQAKRTSHFSQTYRSTSLPSELQTTSSGNSAGPRRLYLGVRSARNCSLSRAPPAAATMWAATVCHCSPGAGRIRLRARNRILFIGCQGCKGARSSLSSSLQSSRENPHKMNQTTALKSRTDSGWVGIYTLTSPRPLFWL